MIDKTMNSNVSFRINLVNQAVFIANPSRPIALY